MKVIMKCVNIKLWDILGCFHYILNAPRSLYFKAENVSEIDDEQHMLLRCSKYSEIRIALFDHVRKSSPRNDTLNEEISLSTFLIPVVRQLKE